MFRTASLALLAAFAPLPLALTGHTDAASWSFLALTVAALVSAAVAVESAR